MLPEDTNGVPPSSEPFPVAHVHWALPPVAGGVETHLADFGRLLAARGHDVTFFTGQGTQNHGPLVRTVQTDLLNLDEYARHRANGNRTANERKLAEELASTMRTELKERGIRVVHGHNLHHFSPVPAMALNLLLGEMDLRLHHTYHSIWDRDGHATNECRSWPGQHATSDYIKGMCAEQLGVSSLRARLGVATDRYDAVPPPPDSRHEKVVLLPARLFPEKGARTALRMLSRLDEEGFPARLILTTPARTVDWDEKSEPFRKELESIISELDIAGHVEFVSAGYEEMPQLYALADIVIYPSEYPEPLGLAPLEASAAGRPVIVTDTGGLPETVLPGVTGYVIPPYDLEALVDRVRGLLAHPEQAREMGEAGRAHIRENFSLDRYVDRMIRLYRTTS